MGNPQQHAPDVVQMPSQQGQSLRIDLSAEIAALSRDESWETKGVGRKPLIRYPDFRITLMGVKGGTRIEEHHNPGRISVQTIEGHIRMRAVGQMFDVPKGCVLVLDRAVRHDVEAVEDSFFLLTAAVPEDGYGH